MATPYNDFRSCTEKHLYTGLPLDARSHAPRSAFSIRTSSKSAEGVAFKASFSQADQLDKETSKPTGERVDSGELALSHSCCEHFGGALKLKSKDNTASGSVWVQDKLLEGLRVEGELKSFRSKGKDQFGFMVSPSFKNDTAAVSLKGECTPVSNKYGVEASVAVNRENFTGGIGAKFDQDNVTFWKEAGLALLWAKDNNCFVAGITSDGPTKESYNLQADVSWCQQLCSECDWNVVAQATLPIPTQVDDKHNDFKLVASTSFKANDDTKLVGHVDLSTNEGFNLGFGADVKLNKNVSVSASTYVGVSDLSASASKRFIDLGVSLSQ